MENSHNYKYVRVKGNGKKGKKQASPAAPLPQAGPAGPPTPRDTATPGSNFSEYSVQEASTPNHTFSPQAASDNFGGGHFGNHLAGTPSSVQFTPEGMSPSEASLVNGSLVNGSGEMMAVDPTPEQAPTTDGNVEFWVNNLPQLTQAPDQYDPNLQTSCEPSPVQLPTPGQSVEHLAIGSFGLEHAPYPSMDAVNASMDFIYDFPPNVTSATEQAPGAIGFATLVDNFIDEGLGDDMNLPCPRNDFPLYEGSHPDVDLHGGFPLFPGPHGIGSGMNTMPPAVPEDSMQPASDPAWREFMAEIMDTDGGEVE